MSNYNGTPLEAKQMSIYDFLQDGESQEVAPSETLPQVDEAQEDEAWKFNAINSPSSALDANKLITDNLVFNPEGYSEKVIELDTVEVTDKALISADPKFEVNQIVTVVNPYDEGLEDYDYMKPLAGKEVRVIEIRSTNRTNTRYYVCEYLDGLLSNGFFYEHELK